MITYNSNIRSLRALAALDRATSAVEQATQRLASGQRINRASDDAAGISVSSGLRADARVFTVGIRNLNDGLSAINVAESGLSALSTVTLRLRELAQQAANGSLSSVQRHSLNDEAGLLTAEFNRVIATTKFNGMSLLDLSRQIMRLQGGYGIDGGFGIDFGSELLRRTGTGSFNSRSAITAVNNPTNTRNADLDGDGDLDILFGLNTSGSMGVMLNNGDGTFQSQVTYGAGAGGAAGFVIGDFTGDGILDAAVGYVAAGNVSIFAGNGDGTFQAGVDTGLTAVGATRLEAADLNGDGILDLVGSSAGAARIAYGTGGGSFSAAESVATSGSSIRQLQIVDFDKDGKLDIVGTSASNTISILKQSGSGAFTLSTVTVNGNANGLQVADFDGDGLNDLAVSYALGGANGWVQTFMQQASGSFTLNQTFGSSVNGQSLNMTDFNGDGVTDLVATNTTNSSILVLVGNANGTFASTSLSSSGTTNHTSLGDFNGDGAVDILARDSATSFALFRGVAATTTTLQRLSLYDSADALRTLSLLDQVYDRISRQRGAFGAYASRLEVALRALRSSADNNEQAASRITDADIGMESANAVRAKIISNAVAGVLAQANQQPALALQLLGGGQQPRF